MAKYPRTWNLENVYTGADSEQFKRDMETVAREIPRLAEEGNGLSPLADGGTDVRSWEKFHRGCIDLALLLGQLGTWVNCQASADTENEDFPPLLGKIAALGARASELDIILKSKLKDSSDAGYDSLIRESDYFREIRFVLDETREQARYMMDESREKLAAALSVDGLSAWGRLYNKISGKLKVKIMEKGEVIEKSVGQVRYDSPERSVRENEFHASLKAWEGVKDTCAEALNHISGTRLTLYREQGYDHFLDKPLLNNRLKRASLDAMWQAIASRKEMLTPYFEIKARTMGVDRLSWFDQVSPMETGRVDFDQAMDVIIEQFGRFNPEMGRFARETVEKGFVESEFRPGKRQGAFCTKFAARREPRVFMTFNDTTDSMSTLAHELGHAYHGYVLRDQPLPLQSYVMCTAETASTFAEEIINSYLIETAETKLKKIAMLDKSISDAMVMMMNIHSRFIFESRFYQAREEGELTPDRFSQLMVDAQKEAFCGLLDQYHPLFWASKLHFYISGLSFYNFPYTFGFFFSNTLYSLAREEGPSFSETYRKILLSTGSMKTEEVIGSNLGMDITRIAFWNKALDLIEDKIRLFVNLAGE